MTCTIVWTLIGSYYSGFPFFSSGLMDAAQPWTGSYNLRSPIWMAAHTTQFTRPGWIYLPVGQGSGKLTHGGSYVTMREPESGDGVAANWAMVIEKMSAYHSSCVRPSLGWYDTAPEVATFKFVFDADSLNMRGVGGAPRREDSDEHATDASDGCAEPTLGDGAPASASITPRARNAAAASGTCSSGSRTSLSAKVRSSSRSKQIACTLSRRSTLSRAHGGA